MKKAIGKREVYEVYFSKQNYTFYQSNKGTRVITHQLNLSVSTYRVITVIKDVDLYKTLPFTNRLKPNQVVDQNPRVLLCENLKVEKGKDTYCSERNYDEDTSVNERIRRKHSLTEVPPSIKESTRLVLMVSI